MSGISSNATRLGAAGLGVVALYALYRYWSGSGDNQLSASASSKTVQPGEYDGSDLGQLQEEWRKLHKLFELPWAQLVTVREMFLREMREGLKTDSESSMAMIPSMVTFLAQVQGTETGDVLALDVGGTNCRVLLLRLNGDGTYTIKDNLPARIPDEVQAGSGESLFDFFATSIGTLLARNNNQATELGFTFSFPIEQKSLNSGHLLRWTKGFTASDTVGEDVCQLLQAALNRKGLQVTIRALINDTVGTLVAGSFQHTSTIPTDIGCSVGLILGTGTNACYWESISNIEKLENPSETAKGMIINMECGNFGSRKDRYGRDLPLNMFDIELDEQSTNKGSQLLEKQVSGMYLGELARLALRSLMSSGAIFKKFSSALAKPYSFGTDLLARIEKDVSSGLSEVTAVLSDNGIAESTIEERRLVKSLAHMIARRSARLAAMMIAAIMRHIGLRERSTVVAVDGSLFEKYSGYSTMMQEALELLVRHKNIRLILTKDGSGVGAGICAHLASIQ